MGLRVNAPFTLVDPFAVERNLRFFPFTAFYKCKHTHTHINTQVTIPMLTYLLMILLKLMSARQKISTSNTRAIKSYISGSKTSTIQQIRHSLWTFSLDEKRRPPLELSSVSCDAPVPQSKRVVVGRQT